MDWKKDNIMNEEVRRKLPSYIQPRDPSVDRRFRPCPDRQVVLDEVFEEEDVIVCDDDDVEQPDITDDGDEEVDSRDTVAVYLRLRPTKIRDNSYVLKENSLVVKTEEITNILKKKINEKHFYFNKTFDEKSTQKDIYDNCIAPHLYDVTSDTGSTFLT